MNPKKNPKADLSRRTGLFFAIGLAIATCVSLFAITLKTSISDKDGIALSAVDDVLEENVDEVIMPENAPPPPPPPPAAPEIPEVIEMVDNKVETEDNDFNTDTSKDDAVKDIPKIEDVEEEVVDEVVPFAIIEDKPMFEACKGLPKGKQQDDCFKQNLDKHVQRNFRYPELAAEMGIQGRVFVQFRINKDGTVSIVGVRGPHQSLEAEARRIIEKLPQLIPGKQRGKAVAVTYAYPIMFKLN